MLARSLSRLEARFTRIGQLFDERYRIRTLRGIDRLSRYHALEGATSQAWQNWCGFCRQVIVEACQGTSTINGATVACIPMPPTAGRIAYVSKQLMAGSGIRVGKESLPHQEPTWGDPLVCLEAVNYFRPGNSAALLVGLNLAYYAPEHLRTVRNATAHFSSSGIADVRRLSVYYRGQGFFHPLDILEWETKVSRENVFLVWLNDLKTMAFEMCQ